MALYALCLVGGCSDDGSDPDGSSGPGGSSGTQSSSDSSSSSSSAGASGGGGGAPDYTTPEGYCATAAERATTCVADPVDAQECIAENTCLESVFAPDVAPAIWQCLAERPCAGKSDDECFDEVADTLPAPDGFDDYKAACDGKVAECTPDFSNDWCATTLSKLLAPAAYDALVACMTKPCAEISDCARAATGDCG